jgi:hypothetical protein
MPRHRSGRDEEENAMKILGVGLGKTGTNSLHEALQMLGFSSLHYDTKRLNDILDGSTPDPDFRRYDDVDAVLDVPTACFYEELRRAYPGLKCILTIRDEDAWWKSIEGHFRRSELDPARHRARARIRELAYGSVVAEEGPFRERYREHNASVRASIPAKELLVMDIPAGDGWEALCPFLGIDDIPDDPFPQSNTAAQHESWNAGYIISKVREVVPNTAKAVCADWQWLVSEAGPNGDAERLVPLMERNGEYWGQPVDAQDAIRAIEWHRSKGTGFLVIPRSKFWWFHEYAQLNAYLRDRFTWLVEDEGVAIVDLGLPQGAIH